MKTKLIYSTAILFSFVIYSCNNESVGTNQSQPNASTFTSFQDLRNSLKPNPYVKTFDPSISFSMTGPGGTTITCTGNSIIDSSGNTVSDDVDISLYEFNTLDEMILAKAPTTSNGNLLVSGGSFEVRVENTATGEELEFTNWGCQCSLDIQTSPSIAHQNQMMLFNGNTNNLDNNGQEVVDWDLQNQGEFEVFDGIFQAWGIDIGFSNCDVLYDMAGENGTQFEATVNGVTDYTSNVEIWLIIDDFPSIVMLTTVNDTPALETYAESIPTGLNGTLIGIIIDDDSYLSFGSLPITVAGDDSFNINVDYGTEAELVALIESLVN
tara:strand:+ start:7939 stop:8910 length:972 start_codon:yes stop_codon:yes gene_type:complete